MVDMVINGLVVIFQRRVNLDGSESRCLAWLWREKTKGEG